jgi:hypothetical protein
MVKTSTPDPLVEGRERCPTACDWLSIVGSKGRKASAPNQTESHVEQVVMDNESEGVYVRAVMENLPTLVRSPSWQGRRQAPKRGRSQGHTINSCMVSTRKETRRKAHVLTPRKNGRTERWNPPKALPGREQAARPQAQAGRMAQEAKASL